MALAISFVQTLVSSQKRVFVCEKRTPKPDFTKSASSDSELVSNMISNNKNKHKSCIYKNIYRSYNHHMIIQLTWISYIQNIYIHIYINTCILMKTWQITNMLIYIKYITELKRFASSSDAIVGFRAHKRSEKLVKIKNWSDKIETQTRIHAKTKDLIRRLVIYLKSYTNEEDED